MARKANAPPLLIYCLWQRGLLEWRSKLEELASFGPIVSLNQNFQQMLVVQPLLPVLWSLFDHVRLHSTWYWAWTLRSAPLRNSAVVVLEQENRLRLGNLATIITLKGSNRIQRPSRAAGATGNGNCQWFPRCRQGQAKLGAWHSASDFCFSWFESSLTHQMNHVVQ